MLAAALHTLRAYAAGGMYDQLGGGFHRYSVDEHLHVPHVGGRGFTWQDMEMGFACQLRLRHQRYCVRAGAHTARCSARRTAFGLTRTHSLLPCTPNAATASAV